MQLFRRRLIACLLPAGLIVVAGCTGSDLDEYHAYEPAPAEVDSSDEIADPPAVAETEAPTPDGPAAENNDETDAADDSPAVAVADVEPEVADPEDETIPDTLPTSIEEAASEITQTAFPAPLPSADEPREIKLLVPEKEFRKEGPDGALRVTFEDLDLLKVLNMEPVPRNAPEYFPDWLKNLDGKRIRIRGFMRPDFGSENIRGFILARDIEACCFGPNTKSYHIIPTILKEGTTTDYIHLRPFDAVGVFRIQVEELTGDDGELEVAFVYVIEDAEVLSN
ncbi:MAG: hypothetical protein DWQ34_16120 [Planctomycetota bacterium]|nr:MAG: hypothetical protein DWQ29_07925 [Planctomycetota bacterium]REJ91050.1 MAG: hypothetical protein DWQ34_16120 [Planctomycetota bacterium]REK30991.1 MAG: hypothetical protein DWQ41_00780 [Planctomycetota bacterium]REK36893.1 MAG: hypothetical protein DWQ45_09830 [Planctomycetota bacterium]